MAPSMASSTGDSSHPATAKSVPHHNIRFPRLNKKYYKRFWPKFLRRSKDKSRDVTSAKPLVSHISPPLMYISGVSNDFTTVTGQWKLCETQAPEMREQQRAMLHRLFADDRSTPLPSSYYKIDTDVFLAKTSTNATNGHSHLYRGSTQSIAESPPPYTNLHNIARDGKTEGCDRARTFDTFLAEEQLGEESLVERAKGRRRDRLWKWFKTRPGYASSTR